MLSSIHRFMFNRSAVCRAAWAIVLTLGLGLACFGEGRAKSSAVPGSADFKPTPEHPMGWRGDGSGIYPEAHPPTVWSRRVADSAVTDALYQGRKPKNEKDIATALPLEFGIVKDWLAVGPFPAESPVDDIEKPLIADEADVRPNENDAVGAMKWKFIHSSIDTQSTHYTNEGTCDNYNVDFVYIYGQLNQQIAYAHTYIYSPTGGPVQLVMRWDGSAAKIWLNGHPTRLNPKDYEHAFKAPATLEKGWNRLLVKLACDKGTGPIGQNPWVSKWLFSMYVSAPLPAQYETKNIAWMTKLPGFSASSPVVVGDRMYATCGISTLVCLSKLDGKVLWMTTATPCDAATAEDQAAPGYKETVEPLAAQIEQGNQALIPEINALNPMHGVPKDKQTAIDDHMKKKRELETKLHAALREIDRKKYVPMNNNEVSCSNGTPCTDGRHIFVAMGGGSKGPGAYVIAAYDLDGKRIWSYHEALGAGEHGTHISPMLIDGTLVYGAKTTILGFNAATGKIAWRDELPHDAENCVGCLYVPAMVGSTPVVIAYPNRVIQVSDGKVLSETPKETFFGGMTTPSVANGMLYSDGDSRKGFQAVQIPASAGAAADISWKLPGKEWRNEKSSGFSIASALVHDGLYYNVDTMGWLSVIDLATHKLAYAQRIEMFQRANRQTFGFTASPTLAGKYLYFFDNTGSALLIDPGAKYTEEGRNILENQVAGDWQAYKQELFYASPVFDGKSLYLKGEEYMYCVRE